MRTLFVVSILLFAALAALGSTAYADPQATRDDIEIRRILNVPRGTVRIAKDPRNDALYTLRQNGAIERIDLAAAVYTPTYSRDDHGIRSGFTGFAIGPDGSFYLSSNRRGPRDSGQFALARGLLLDADGTFYVLKRIDLSSYNIATITKGEVDPSSEVLYTFHNKQGDIVTEKKWYSFPKVLRDRVDTVIASGAYLYQLSAGDFVATRQLMLLK